MVSRCQDVNLLNVDCEERKKTFVTDSITKDKNMPIFLFHFLDFTINCYV